MQKYLSSSKFLIKEVEYFNVMHWHSIGANGTRHADNDKDINPNCSYGCVLYLNDDYIGGEPVFWHKNKKTEEEITLKINLGEGLIYDGTDTYHSVTKQTKGCIRMVIIIPLYTNYTKNVIGIIREKVRNITYRILTL